MNKYEVAKRLRKLEIAECKVVNREKALVQRDFKHNEKRMQLITEIEELLTKTQQKSNALAKLEESKKALEKFIKQEHSRLEQMHADIEQAQQAVAEKISRQSKERKNALELMESIHTLKETTSIFINTKTILQRIQGLSIHEHDKDTTWFPININPNEFSMEETQSLAWQENAEHIGRYTAVWEHLFFDAYRRQFSETMEQTLKQ